MIRDTREAIVTGVNVSNWRTTGYRSSSKRAQTLTAVVTDKYGWLPSHGLLALTLSEVRRVGKPAAGIRAWER